MHKEIEFYIVIQYYTWTPNGIKFREGLKIIQYTYNINNVIKRMIEEINNVNSLWESTIYIPVKGSFVFKKDSNNKIVSIEYVENENGFLFNPFENAITKDFHIKNLCDEYLHPSRYNIHISEHNEIVNKLQK